MIPFAAVVSVEPPNAALAVAEPVAATQWQYRSDDGWVDFDSDSCATLSTVVGETQLVIGERVYSVDAERTFQTNPVTGYRRAIRRAPYGLGVAEMASARAPVRTRQPGAHAGRGVWEWQEFPNKPWAPYHRTTNTMVVDGVPVADAVAAPYVPTPELQRRVHELVRAGKPISEKDARAYSRTLTEAQYTNQNKALLGFHRGNTCCPVLNSIHGPCLSSVPVYFLPCFPLLFLCCMGREDPDHRFVSVMVGENGEEISSCVIVDHERGTFARFHTGAFWCYYEKM